MELYLIPQYTSSEADMWVCPPLFPILRVSSSELLVGRKMLNAQMTADLGEPHVSLHVEDNATGPVLRCCTLGENAVWVRRFSKEVWDKFDQGSSASLYPGDVLTFLDKRYPYSVTAFGFANDASTFQNSVKTSLEQYESQVGKMFSPSPFPLLSPAGVTSESIGKAVGDAPPPIASSSPAAAREFVSPNGDTGQLLVATDSTLQGRFAKSRQSVGQSSRRNSMRGTHIGGVGLVLQKETDNCWVGNPHAKQQQQQAQQEEDLTKLSGGWGHGGEQITEVPFFPYSADSLTQAAVEPGDSSPPSTSHPLKSPEITELTGDGGGGGGSVGAGAMEAASQKFSQRVFSRFVEGGQNATTTSKFFSGSAGPCNSGGRERVGFTFSSQQQRKVLRRRPSVIVDSASLGLVEPADASSDKGVLEPATAPFPMEAVKKGLQRSSKLTTLIDSEDEEEDENVVIVMDAVIVAGEEKEEEKEKSSRRRKAAARVSIGGGSMCGSVEEEKDDDDDDECPLKPPPPQLPPGTVCPVCRDTMSCVEEVGALGCGHTFCFDCIHQWSGVTNHCCLCKTEFHYIDSWLQRLEDGEGGGGEGGATGGGCSSGRVIIPPPPSFTY